MFHLLLQIMELEQKNAQLQEELASAPSSKRAAGLTGWVPRNPARHTLQGHRSQVLRATFHPVFSLVISVSDDASIKVWDWETGEFERTLKGHTKAVHDADFDSKGNLLGELEPRNSVIRHLYNLLCSFPVIQSPALLT